MRQWAKRLIYRRLTLVEDVMITSDGRWAKADAARPMFIVAEAKRTRTLVESSSEAELIDHLKKSAYQKVHPATGSSLSSQFSLSICTLTISARKSHMG